MGVRGKDGRESERAVERTGALDEEGVDSKRARRKSEAEGEADGDDDADGVRL